MKKLLCLMLAACLIFAMTACGGSAQEEPAAEAPESEQAADASEGETGTAGSNIPLKDNQEEAEYQIKVAMQELLKESYGDKITDARIYVEKIYTAEDEAANEAVKSLNLGPDEVAFEVRYELHPAEGTDVNELLPANGQLDEESGWVIDKFGLGVLRPADDGTYTITDFGTGW